MDVAVSLSLCSHPYTLTCASWLLNSLSAPQALKTARIKRSLVLAPSRAIPNKPSSAALTLSVALPRAWATPGTHGVAVKAAVTESRNFHLQIHGVGEFLWLLKEWIHDGSAGGSSVSVHGCGLSSCSAGNFPLLNFAMVPARMGRQGWIVSRATLESGRASPWISLPGTLWQRDSRDAAASWEAQRASRALGWLSPPPWGLQARSKRFWLLSVVVGGLTLLTRLLQLQGIVAAPLHLCVCPWWPWTRGECDLPRWRHPQTLGTEELWVTNVALSMDGLMLH